jgi:hypothetical protein
MLQMLSSNVSGTFFFMLQGVWPHYPDGALRSDVKFFPWNVLVLF